MEMIKVLHLITDLNSGGAERMLTKLVAHGQSKAVRHVVVCMMGRDFFGPEIETAGVRLYTLNMSQGRPSLSGFFGLLKILRQERPDIVQTWLYHADLLGLIGAKLTGVRKIVWNVRCSNMEMQRYSPLSRMVLKALVLLSSIPDAIIVNSNAGREAHIALGYRARHWHLIPNGFDPEAFRPGAVSRTAFRQDIGISPKTVLFGMVARYDHMKDHAGCIEALARLPLHELDVHFVFVGNGCDEGGPLHTLIRERDLEHCVTLLGESRNVAKVLQGLDVLLLSSSYGEGFPNVVGEAMATGIPVVVTDVGDGRMLVGEGGTVVPPNDPAALSAAISQMVDMGADGRQEMGRRGRKRIEAEYSMDSIVDQYSTFYQQRTKG